MIYPPYPNPRYQNVEANPLTPSYMQGLRGVMENSPQSRLDPLIIQLDVTLTASVVNSQQQITVDADADLMLYGISIPDSDGLFSFQLNNSQLYYLSNTLVLSTIYSTDPLNPTPILGDYYTGIQTGGMWFAAGSRIGVIMTELSGSENTIQMLFHCAKLFRTR